MKEGILATMSIRRLLKTRAILALAVGSLVCGLLMSSSRPARADGVPTGMLSPGTYPLVMNDGLDSGATLRVSLGAFYFQDYNFGPDTMDLALFSDPTIPDQVDIQSMTLDGIAFYANSNTPYEKFLPNGSVVPGTSAYQLWTNPSDPYGAGVIQLSGSFTTYPPVADFSSGSAVLVQQISGVLNVHTADGTLNGTGSNLNGQIQRIHAGVVGDPSRVSDSFYGHLSGTDLTPSGQRQIGTTLKLGQFGWTAAG
jgi:hypothetical protein